MAKRVAKVASGAARLGADEAAPAAAPVISLLSEVIGQDAARRILSAAMASERVHHAWIFHGPAGVGKLTTARAFAATLLDATTKARKGGEIGPEADSQVQRLVKAGNHPDLHIINKELAAISREKSVRDGKQTTIAKDVLEEFLLEPAAKTRVMVGEAGGQSPAGKVFIVDEAELLDARGQNTLLKTLEEPPAGTVIILVTSSEDRLLPTIRSRCQRVGFTVLNDEQMAAWMESGASGGVGGGVGAAVRGLDAKRRAWVRDFARGSPGLAMLAIDNDLFGWHETLGPMLAVVDRGGFSPELGPAMAKLINERAEADVKKNPDASKDGANKAWSRRMLAFVGEHFRRGLRERAPKAGPDDAGVGRALAAIEAVQSAEGYLASNVQLAMVMENLSVQLGVADEAAIGGAV